MITDPGFYGIRYEDFNFSTFDNFLLKGWLLKTENPKATIIFLHGIADSRYSHLEFLSKFVKYGYNVLMYDARAHGESGGYFCTYGFYEKRDILSAIQNLDIKQKIDEKSIIGLMGVSLGGAVVLQSLNLDKRIKFCITEAAFSDFRSTMDDYRSRGIFALTKIFSNILDKRIEKIGKFKINDIMPKDQLREFSGKVLLVHGENDKKINIKYHTELIENARNYESLIIKKADHNDIRIIGGEDYTTKLLRFADNTISEISR